MTYFYQNIEELEAKLLPSMHVEVLEERRGAVEGDIWQIREAKVLYAKMYA